ncbi:hypothetical protein SAMN02910447_00240 [Ruminococcus sp. YE71]|uniref:hypothetical protein n=1 Tax=unclassified Ruminococcus TaxID=2608920 RepID=UPI000885E9D5|nr:MULTISPECIES: hypothetical protein [unclassified Ruminococcus]SDA09480.1 hypothetical protein SAMN02910446_00109 [Ruminococcus sp. YE78]SFW12185.1 hypothetical protein SAMN02910447_00240 [Ruminococcus sp. YE71]
MEKLISIKRAAAVCCAALLVSGSLTGCGSSTSYAMKVGDEEIKAGVYIYNIISETNSQMYTLYYSGSLQNADDAFSQKIDGKDFVEVVQENALKTTKEMAAVDAKFKELGLELSDEDIEAINNTVSSTWESGGGMYEYAGVSKESFRVCTEHSYKKKAIFDHYYADGGTDEVTADALQSYVNENYIRYKMISIAKSAAEDEETKKSENEEAEALLNEYYEKAKDVDFEGFDAIIDEYNAYQEAKKAAESAEAPEAGDSTEIEDGDESAADGESAADSSAADESAADTSESAESTEDSASEGESTVSEGEITSLEAENTESVTESAVTAEESTADESTSEETESTADESTADESAADESTADETETTDGDTSSDDGLEVTSGEEEAKDPYANEYVMNASTYLDTTSESYDEKYADMIKTIKDQEYNKAALYTESESSYVLFITDDIAERTDYVEENKDTLRHEIKDTEFEDLINGWIESAGIKVNEKAVKKYSVKEIYDRQTEYSKKNPNS